MRHAIPVCRLLRLCQHQLTILKDYKHEAFLTIATHGKASCTPAAVSANCQATFSRSISSGSSSSSTVCGALLLDGRAVAAAWEKELLVDVRQLTELLGRPPGLGVVLVGSRPDSMLYVTKKQQACQKAGMQTFVHHLPDCVSQSQLEAAVSHVCADCRVDGVLVQLPLPRHLSEEAVMEVLDPRKDVDGFHPLNMGRMLMRGRGVRLVPATPLGCIELLRRSGVEMQGKTCVVLGDSNIVGTPLAAMLRDKGAAAVTICHRRSYRDWFEDQDQVQRTRAAAAVCLPRLPGPMRPPPGLKPEREQQQQPAVVASNANGNAGGGNASTSVAAVTVAGGDGDPLVHDSFQSYQLPYLTRSADILVVAVGHPELVRGDWVRPGAVVVDVGINVISALPRAPCPVASPASTAAMETVTAASEMKRAHGAAGFECELDGGRSISSSSGSDGSSSRGRGGAHGDSNSRSNGTRGVGLRYATGGAVPDGVHGNNGGWRDNGCSSHNRDMAFQVVGDVAFDEVSQVAGAITPVPGGVGPMTIAAVLHNTLKAAKYRVGLEPW